MSEMNTIADGTLPGHVGTEPRLVAANVSSLLRRAVSFPAMLATLLVGAVFVVARALDINPDFWWHVKVGETILATHRWPTVDPFSFTVAGQPWLAYEWLGDVLFASVARVAGLQGLAALLIVLSSAILLALYAYATLRCGNSKAGFVAAATLLVLASQAFTLRPQMLGYLFLILTLTALERFRQGKPGALNCLPLLFLVWINTHGSWVIGLGTILVFWVCGLKEFRVGDVQSRRWARNESIRLGFVFLLCLAVIPITPYGSRLAAYPFEVASSLPLNVANVSEWRSMPFNELPGKLFLALLVGFFVVRTVFRATWRLEELVLFLGGAVMACLHVRFLLLFVPFFAPVLAAVLARWVSAYDRAKDHFVLNGLLMAGAVALMIVYFPSRGRLEETVAQQSPVRAVEYLRQHPVPGPMFETYEFGDYLVWSMAPGQKVFIDGRGELYERGGVFADYVHIAGLRPGALGVLRAYGVRSCLVRRDEPLVTVLAALPDWQQVYSDDLSLVFVRRLRQDTEVDDRFAVVRESEHGSTRRRDASATGREE
jgi:hypothetical protein